MKIRFIYLFISIISFVFTSTLLADDIAEKAKRMKSYNFNYLLFLDIPLKNFATEDQKKIYSDLKAGYAQGMAYYYERKYLESYKAFVVVLESAEKLYEQFSLDYINRTSEMLQKSTLALVDVGIKYHRDADKITKMLTNIEPPYEKPQYDPQEFHYTYDKHIMARNMDRAYLYVGYATELRKRGITIENVLEKDRVISPEMRLVRVDQYKKAIELCRQAKINAIYIYQLINTNKMLELKQYENNPYLLEKRLDPIFDKRIPDEYVVDANDSLNRSHQDEIDIRINLKQYDVKARDRDLAKEAQKSVSQPSTTTAPAKQ